MGTVLTLARSELPMLPPWLARGPAQLHHTLTSYSGACLRGPCAETRPAPVLRSLPYCSPGQGTARAQPAHMQTQQHPLSSLCMAAGQERGPHQRLHHVLLRPEEGGRGGCFTGPAVHHGLSGSATPHAFLPPHTTFRKAQTGDRHAGRGLFLSLHDTRSCTALTTPATLLFPCLARS